MKGTLYIVATPIGNTEDITARAKRILGEADIIAAEDTRNTQKLLGLLGLKNKTVSNHKFNEKSQVDFLLDQLENGRNVAVVSDAGTPCISDPGGIIVKAAAEHGITVTGICGASAVMTALSVSGFSFETFTFYGFLPRKAAEIKKAIGKIMNGNAGAAVFFESPKRIKKSLELFAAMVPLSQLCLCNDLTKKFERIYRGTPQLILDELNANPSAEKGEYTLAAVCDGTTPASGVAASGVTASSVADMAENRPCYEAMLVDRIVKNGGSLKDAVDFLAQKYEHKKEIYAASLRLRKMFND